MNHNHTDTKHLLIMLACCLIPIALIIVVGAFGFSLGALTPLLPFALVLMCPLMMIFMMRGMGHAQDTHDAHHHSDAPMGNTSKDTIPSVGVLKADAASKRE
jgi:nitrate reductase NapE component